MNHPTGKPDPSKSERASDPLERVRDLIARAMVDDDREAELMWRAFEACRLIRRHGFVVVRAPVKRRAA